MRQEIDSSVADSAASFYHSEEQSDSLRVTEIYLSIQGESTHAGRPCTFIRLTGCPLRCRWCDTSYSFQGGDVLSFQEILSKVASFKTSLVEVTGGEPLAQPNCRNLLMALIAQGYEVLIETSGSESIAYVPRPLRVIMDIKCPGSGMENRNSWKNIEHLQSGDEVKFVIADKRDFAWALARVKQYKLTQKVTVLFSPAFGLLAPNQLVDWQLTAGLTSVRLNLQLHKYIWSPRAKGV